MYPIQIISKLLHQNCKISQILQKEWGNMSLPPFPLLYSLYTYGSVAVSDSTSMIKFADDTVMVRLISDNIKKVYWRRLGTWRTGAREQLSPKHQQG